jgi:hypothetical protein
MNIYIMTILIISIFSLLLYGQNSAGANKIKVNPIQMNQNATKPPFRKAYLEPETVSNILFLNTGDDFSLQIFDKILTFRILSKKTLDTNEIKIEAVNQVDGIDTYLRLSKNIETGKIVFFYTDILCMSLQRIIRYSSEQSELEETKGFTICGKRRFP